MTNYEDISAKWLVPNRKILVFQIGEEEEDQSRWREKYWKLGEFFCAQSHPQ